LTIEVCVKATEKYITVKVIDVEVV